MTTSVVEAETAGEDTLGAADCAAGGVLAAAALAVGAGACVGAALAGAGWTLTHSTYNTTVQLAASRWVTATSMQRRLSRIDFS